MIINWGDAPFKAFITVTYSRGSCTVSLGNKSFTHSGGGTHTFTVNKKGTWTITANSGDDLNLTTTDTANITERAQTVSLNLKYTLYLYNAGDECSAVTGGWKFGVWGKPVKRETTIYLYINTNYGCTVSTSNTNIDLSKFSTLYVRLVAGSSSGGMKFDISAGGAKVSYSPSAGTFSLDIASVSSGQVIITANGYYGDGGSTTYFCAVEISEIYVQ